MVTLYRLWAIYLVGFFFLQMWQYKCNEIKDLKVGKQGARRMRQLNSKEINVSFQQKPEIDNKCLL